ncbi:MAG: hypothetical protein QG625_731 [Cyanobacteriota bacterium erpe_2018_sw_39hr_WHONDRS-SW48-000098_B_bin.30]|jgi:hypothetical protein|nr:hypothetical protein [Candidatus Obscuribacter sp.]MBK9619354.1 hypothetical protein [Candidatus Obscuribacter sp.]MDQ5964577.1 hypothetical protein [Cyanobacteriota bacterium erpe_2018_sw_39hr_WHONDRS-SW48-000098_B_bin.30]
MTAKAASARFESSAGAFEKQSGEKHIYSSLQTEASKLLSEKEAVKVDASKGASDSEKLMGKGHLPNTSITSSIADQARDTNDSKASASDTKTNKAIKHNAN